MLHDDDERDDEANTQHQTTHLPLDVVAEKQVAKDQLVLGQLLARDDDRERPLHLVVQRKCLHALELLAVPDEEQLPSRVLNRVHAQGAARRQRVAAVYALAGQLLHEFQVLDEGVRQQRALEVARQKFER